MHSRTTRQIRALAIVAAIVCGALPGRRVPTPLTFPCAFAGEGDAPAAVPRVDLASAEASAWMRQDWYGVFCGETRVGWMRRSLGRADFGGVPSVVREVEVHLDVAGDGNEVLSATRTVCRADGDQALLAAWSERRDQGKRTAREIVRQGQRFDVVTERRGERIEGAVPAVEISLADELGIERVVALAARGAAAPGTSHSLRVASIDFATLAAGERRMTVSAVTGEGAARIFTVDVEIRPADGAHTGPDPRVAKDTVRVDATGAVVEGSLGPRFSYRMEDEVIAKHAQARKSLEVLSRIPLDERSAAPSTPGSTPVATPDDPTAPKPTARIGDIASVKKLTIAWDGAKGRVFVANTRQRVRIQGTSLVVEIGRDADAASTAVAADEASQRDALVDEPGLGVLDPLVGKAASLLLRGTSTRGQQVARLLEFTSTRMTKEVVLGTPSTMEILQSLRGDCTEHSQLFVSLCRVAGIPARTVEGLAWMGDDVGAFGWHQWAEVALGGKWLALDPTTGADPAPATNIAVDATPELRTLMWGARLRLVAIEREERKSAGETFPKGVPGPDAPPAVPPAVPPGEPEKPPR